MLKKMVEHDVMVSVTSINIISRRFADKL